MSRLYCDADGGSPAGRAPVFAAAWLCVFSAFTAKFLRACAHIFAADSADLASAAAIADPAAHSACAHTAMSPQAIDRFRVSLNIWQSKK